MASFKYFLLLAIFACVSVQLPQPGSAPALRRRSHPISNYTSLLTKGRPGTSDFERRGDNKLSGGGGYIVGISRQKYLFPLSLGTETFDVELDTGSSDTWLMGTGFQCYDNITSDFNFTGPVAQSKCNFGATYTPGADFSTWKNIVEISCYGNGYRCVSGPFGHVDVTIAGVTVSSLARRKTVPLLT